MEKRIREVGKSDTIRSLLEEKIGVESHLAEMIDNLVAAIYNDPEARRFIKIDWQRMEVYYGLRPDPRRGER